MDEVAFVFAQQLYDHHPAISKDRSIIIVEDPQFFQSSEGRMKFHKLKLVMHQTTMQAYRDRLVQRGCDAKYLAIDQDFLTALQQEDVSRIYT